MRWNYGLCVLRLIGTKKRESVESCSDQREEGGGGGGEAFLE